VKKRLRTGLPRSRYRPKLAVEFEPLSGWPALVLVWRPTTVLSRVVGGTHREPVGRGPI